MYCSSKDLLQILFLFVIGLSFGCVDKQAHHTGQVKDENSKMNPLFDSEYTCGQVVYSVEFPFITDKTLLKWCPTEYTATFNKNELYGEMNSKLDVICNRFYANKNEMKLEQTLENLSGKYACSMNATDVNDLRSKLPRMTIGESIGDTIIAGVPCDIALANFENDSTPPVVLYYTDKIKVDNPNWYNQYENLDKFLMGYEVEQFGMRMKLMAKSFTNDQVAVNMESVFSGNLPETYSRKSPNELQVILKDMLNEFME